ncbi:hypothetical protein LIA77_08036 [Sarocladium implicatum]|nr:hypothetical protein LIA77_08036 [Sarocladium implicatum]
MASNPSTTISYANVLSTPYVAKSHARSFTAPAVFRTEPVKFSKIISEQEIQQKDSPAVEDQKPTINMSKQPLPDGHWSMCKGTFAINDWKKAPRDIHVDGWWYFDMLTLGSPRRDDEHKNFTIESGKWQAIMGEDHPDPETMYARIASPSETPAPVTLSVYDTYDMATDHFLKTYWDIDARMKDSFFYKGVEFRFGLKWEFPQIQYHIKCHQLHDYCERFDKGVNDYGSHPGTVKCELTGQIHNVRD